MNFEARRDFDEWFIGAYESLCESARSMHRDYRDLVHHVYLACIRANPPNIMRNPAAYFHTAMWTQATRGTFKSEYQLRDVPQVELISESDMALIIRREQVMILTQHLKWFDRQVLRLYLEGYNLRQVSRESGINHSVLYQSLHRTRKLLSDAIRKQQSASS